jgi:hypothetical protein
MRGFAEESQENNWLAAYREWRNRVSAATES